MFEHLAKHGRIFVTGQQRSGTRICAHMIAHDTGYRYVDAEPGNHCSWEWHANNLRGKAGFVKHCPFLSRYIQHFADEDTLIVWMLRDEADIRASQRRIGWHDTRELARYPGATVETIAREKLAYWRDVQRARCVHWLEVEYESLRDHPLWLGRGQRQGFGPLQWRKWEA